MGPGWSLKKGICLVGGVGTGKTTLMKMFAENQRRSFRVVPCRRVVEKFEETKSEAIRHFSRDNYRPDWTQTIFLHKFTGFCFDDLGTEAVVKSYGNEVNVMLEILLNRYELFPNVTTHLTSNLNADQVESQYGTRLRSRMREMFNMLELSGNDRRR